MLVFKLMSLMVIVFIFAVGITQVIVPAYKGLPMFPVFRKQRKLEKEVSELKQQKVEQSISKQIETLKKELTNDR